MTPLQIEILLHYRCCRDDYRNGDFSAPAVRSEIDAFKAGGFLKAGTDRCYELDERGEVFVQALCELPYPARKWVMPSGATPQ